MHIYLLLLSTLLTAAASSGSTEKIEPSREDIETHLSSKTPYRVIANRNDKEVKYPGESHPKEIIVEDFRSRTMGRKEYCYSTEGMFWVPRPWLLQCLENKPRKMIPTWNISVILYFRSKQEVLLIRVLVDNA